MTDGDWKYVQRFQEQLESGDAIAIVVTKDLVRDLMTEEADRDIDPEDLGYEWDHLFDVLDEEIDAKIRDIGANTYD